MHLEPIKSVFILGAGASRAAGAPLMYDFIKAADKVRRRNDAGWAKEHFESSLYARQKLQGAFAKSTIELDNIESLFSTFEMASLVGRLANLPEADVASLPRSLRYVIMRTLEQSIKYPIRATSPIVAAPFPYDAFVDLLAELQNKRDIAPVAVINFNYDLCLDYALTVREFDTNYGLGASAGSAKSIPHYKVHGSLNWHRSEDGQHIVPRPLQGLRAERYYNRLGLNHEEEHPIDTMELIGGPNEWGSAIRPEPIIVPPTWNKGWYQEQLKSVWRAASHAISTAENVFVIGYSLPPSDRFFKDFWSISSMSDTVVERFWLFDPATDISLRNRFASMLGPAIIERSCFKHEALKFSAAIRYLSEQFELNLDCEQLEDR